MKTCGALAVGVVVCSMSLGGCGSSRSTVMTLGSEPVEATGVMVRVSSDGGSGLVSLGAGDRLGQHIHVFDVYLAAMELMGPEPVPAPRELNLVAWDTEGLPITADVGLSLAMWD